MGAALRWHVALVIAALVALGAIGTVFILRFRAEIGRAARSDARR